MKNLNRRILAAVLVLALVLGTGILTVSAAEGEGPAVCSCTSRCTQESFDASCPVCAAAWQSCAFEEPQSTHREGCARTDEHTIPAGCMTEAELAGLAGAAAPAAIDGPVTLRVNADGNDGATRGDGTAFSTIAKAIEAAEAGDTVLIEGAHTLTDTLILKRGIILRGAEGNILTVSGELYKNGDHPVFRIDAAPEGVVMFDGLNLVIASNSFNILLANGRTVTVQNCSFTANEGVTLRKPFNSLGGGSKLLNNTVKSGAQVWNNVKNANGILSVRTNGVNDVKNGVIEITGNTFENFARGIAVDHNAANTPVTATGNKFLEVDYAFEVAAGTAQGQYDFSHNYCDGKLPQVLVADSSPAVTAVAPTVYPYYNAVSAGGSLSGLTEAPVVLKDSAGGAVKGRFFTIYDALAAAADRDTLLISGEHTLTDALVINKAVTLKGEAGNKLTAEDEKLGQNNGTLFIITVNGVTLDGLDVAVAANAFNLVQANGRTVTVQNCSFTANTGVTLRKPFNSLGGGSKLLNNTVKSGAQVWNGAENANGILSVRTSSVDVTEGTIEIIGNTFENFARGVSVDYNAANTPVTATGNRFLSVKYAFEVAAGTAQGQYDFSHNYCGGMLPQVLVADSSPAVTAASPTVYPYYSDAALSTLVQQPADATAVEVARIITDLNTAIDTAVPGKTIDTIVGDELTAHKDALGPALDAATAALAGIDPAALERYLGSNPAVKAVVEKIYSAFVVVCQVTPVPQRPAASSDVEGDADKKKAADELTDTKHPAATYSPESLVAAVAGSLSVTEDTQVYIKTTITDIQNPASRDTFTLVFEAKPYQKPSGGVETPIENSSLNGRPITLRLPLPASINSSQVKVVHERTGSPAETFYLPVQSGSADGNYRFVDVTVREFSVFKVSPYVRPTSGGSDDSREHDEYLFWSNIRDEIEAAEKGDVIYARAKDMTEVPVTVMRALYGKNVTLIISHGGEEYTINGKKMTKPEQNRIYYTFEQIDALYGKGAGNPETGGVVNVPSVPVTPPAVVTPSVPEVPVEPPVSRPEPITPVEPEPEQPAVAEPTPEPARQMPAIWIPIAIAFASMVLIGGIGFGIYRRRSH